MSLRMSGIVKYLVGEGPQDKRWSVFVGVVVGGVGREIREGKKGSVMHVKSVDYAWLGWMRGEGEISIDQVAAVPYWSCFVFPQAPVSGPDDLSTNK